ncbi:hypothetical protein B0H14DRAFT_1121966 [Mycena olivaceomarginata]|nr:hypothetical protein B0H14DRAFT_1121966 [Mycena olivaceomarginata]
MHPAAGQCRQNKEHGASAGANAKASSSPTSSYSSSSLSPLRTPSPPRARTPHAHPYSHFHLPFAHSPTHTHHSSRPAPPRPSPAALVPATVRRLVARTRGRQKEWEACFGSGGEALVLTRLVLGVASSSSNGRYASGEANGHGEGAEGARGMGSIAGGGDRAAITGSRLCLCRARARSPPLRSRLRGRYPQAPVKEQAQERGDGVVSYPLPDVY